MRIIREFKQIIKAEGFVLVRKYIRRAAILAFLISFGLVLFGVLYLVLQKQLDDFIVEMDLRYNSPIILEAIKLFLATFALSVFYGAFLSIRDYKRPSDKWFFKHSYENGTSFKALKAYKEFSKNKLNNGQE